MNIEDVNKILEKLHSNDWSKNYILKNEELKKNTWFSINAIPQFNFVKDIINTDLKNINENYKCSEWITLLIYETGDFFGLHNDDYVSQKKQILFSGGYLLNKDYEGGEFIIGDKKLEVGIGELFYFSRKEEHEVKKIKSGKRYSLHFAIEIENNNKTLI